MSNHPVIIDVAAEEWSPVQWALHVWSWVILLLLFVALELWADPLMASLVLSLKLGWRDVFVAFRLNGQLSSGFAKALGLFSVALACFKVAVAGIVLTVAVVSCETILGFPPQIERFVAGFTMLVVGLGIAALALLFAAGAANSHGVRPWLDGTIYENLFQRNAPLRCHGTRNRVRWLLVLGMVLITVTFLSSPLIAVAVLIRFGNPMGLPGGTIFMILWYFTFRTMRTAMANVAQTPDECW